MEKEQILKNNLEIFIKAYNKKPSSQLKYAIKIYEKELERYK